MHKTSNNPQPLQHVDEGFYNTEDRYEHLIARADIPQLKSAYVDMLFAWLMSDERSDMDLEEIHQLTYFVVMLPEPAPKEDVDPEEEPQQPRPRFDLPQEQE